MPTGETTMFQMRFQDSRALFLVPRLNLCGWKIPLASLDLCPSIPSISDCFKEDMLSSINVFMDTTLISFIRGALGNQSLFMHFSDSSDSSSETHGGEFVWGYRLLRRKHSHTHGIRRG